MNLNYDMISLFLIIFIFYYLLFVISNKYVIEGNDGIEGIENSLTTDTPGAIMCLDYDDPTHNFHTCLEWPFKYKSYASTEKQCIDGSDRCSEERKIRNCCDQRAEMCQGNIESHFQDFICRGENNIPKLDAVSLPRLCEEGNSGNCWNQGYPGETPPGLPGCSNTNGTCNLSDLGNENRQEICCTNSDIYEIAEKIWGRPHLITAAIVKYNDLKNIQDTESNEYYELLNEALSYLNQARDIGDDDDRNIIHTITDWSAELNQDLGTGVCRGNINRESDFPCLLFNPPKQYINKAFITKGTTEEECCVVSGMCSGNTNSIENIECPENMHITNNMEGTTIEECCRGDIKCRGNTNINLNYDCPEPMIPIVDANNTFGTTKEECCRFPDDIHHSEIPPTFENETIKGTIVFNGDLLQSAGTEGSAKRILFETNFKEDIVDIFNKEGKINVLREQIFIKKIHSGSVIVDFEVSPHYSTGVSISKGYFSYLLSGKIYFPTIKLHTDGSVTNVSILSWYNINYWPTWIWYVIISIITFLITSVIVI